MKGVSVGDRTYRRHVVRITFQGLVLTTDAASAVGKRVITKLHDNVFF